MFIYVLLAATCGLAYGAAINEGRIVGGEKVNIESFPYQVGLFFFNKYICGGAIVNSNYVITAAHCIPKFPQFLRVRYGLNNTNDQNPKYSVKVRNAIIHPNYKLTYFGSARNDIAILQLDKPIVFNHDALAIGIASHEPNPGQMIAVTGYGDINEFEDSDGGLLAVSLPIVDKNYCKNVYKYFGIGHINEEVICGGFREGKKDSCQGDSGGPAVLNGKLVGIISFGYGCARPGIPGVYTNVANYYQWIMKHTTIHE